MRRVKRRRIRRFLEVLPMIDQAQKELKRPLILTVGPWGAERHVRNTVAERQAGAQRRARAFSGLQCARRSVFERENLSPVRQSEPEFGNGRRAPKPAATRCDRNEIALTIRHIEMHRIAGRDRDAARAFIHRHRVATVENLVTAAVFEAVYNRPSIAQDRARPNPCRRFAADQAPAFGVIGGR